MSRKNKAEYMDMYVPSYEAIEHDRIIINEYIRLGIRIIFDGGKS